MCAIGRTGFDVRPYLALISTSTAAVLGYFWLNAENLPHDRLSNAFWEPP